jgi:hypothetical protein
VDPGSLSGGGEPDDAVEALVVRDGKPGQPESDRAIDQSVRRRNPIEKGEIRVTMQFGERGPIDHRTVDRRTLVLY